MARGIWKNGLLKIFLTRSCLGFIFRPLMYSREEAIHFEFLCPFITLTKEMINIAGYWERSLFYYWLLEVPQALFEKLFLSNEKGQRIFALLDDADPVTANNIAYLTQGYVWYCLEYLLQTDSGFCDKFGMDATALHKMICSVLGWENPALHYQQEFSNLAASNSELTSKKIQHCFLEKMISGLGDTANPEQFYIAKEKYIKEGMAFCSWKINNAKYLTIAMFDEIKQGEAVSAKTLSRLM